MAILSLSKGGTTPSLSATTATLLLEADRDIRKVQELLGHRHVITTQIYDKRRRTAKENASPSSQYKELRHILLLL